MHQKRGRCERPQPAAGPVVAADVTQSSHRLFVVPRAIRYSSAIGRWVHNCLTNCEGVEWTVLIPTAILWCCTFQSLWYREEHAPNTVDTQTKKYFLEMQDEKRSHWRWLEKCSWEDVREIILFQLRIFDLNLKPVEKKISFVRRGDFVDELRIKVTSSSLKTILCLFNW